MQSQLPEAYQKAVPNMSEPMRPTKTYQQIPMKYAVGTNLEELQYLALVRRVMAEGDVHLSDRTGVGTKMVVAPQLRFSLQNDTLPLLTSKRMFWKGVVTELMWMVRGLTDVRWLQERNVHFWDANVSRAQLDAVGMEHYREGLLGKGYGYQWRHTGKDYAVHTGEVSGRGVDQLALVLESLKHQPESRRHLVVSWNPLHLKDMALPPCHCLFQFFVQSPLSGATKPRLSCQLYQRSGDLGLGVPMNIAFYSLLTHIMAHLLDMDAYEFIITLGDAHVYLNHFEGLQKQLDRSPRPFPRVTLSNITGIDTWTEEHIQLRDYYPHPTIKLPMAL